MQSFVPTNAVDLRAAGGNRLIQLEALPNSVRGSLEVLRPLL